MISSEAKHAKNGLGPCQIPPVKPVACLCESLKAACSLSRFRFISSFRIPSVVLADQDDGPRPLDS